MLNLSLKKLKLIERNKKINIYRSMSEVEILGIMNRSEPIKIIGKETEIVF